MDLSFFFQKGKKYKVSAYVMGDVLQDWPRFLTPGMATQRY